MQDIIVNIDIFIYYYLLPVTTPQFFTSYPTQRHHKAMPVSESDSFSMSIEDYGVDDTTRALTEMTGWTSANGAGEGSELGKETGNFPMAHSKYKSATYTETIELGQRQHRR